MHADCGVLAWLGMNPRLARLITPWRLTKNQKSCHISNCGCIFLLWVNSNYVLVSSASVSVFGHNTIHVYHKRQDYYNGSRISHAGSQGIGHILLAKCRLSEPNCLLTIVHTLTIYRFVVKEKEDTERQERELEAERRHQAADLSRGGLDSCCNTSDVRMSSDCKSTVNDEKCQF